MENNNGFNKGYLVQVLTVAIFCGLGFWAAGPMGAVFGLILAMSKAGKGKS